MPDLVLLPFFDSSLLQEVSTFICSRLSQDIISISLGIRLAHFERVRIALQSTGLY